MTDSSCLLGEQLATVTRCSQCRRAIPTPEPVCWIHVLDGFGDNVNALACESCGKVGHSLRVSAGIPASQAPRPCVGCARSVYSYRWRHPWQGKRPYCSKRCLWTFYNRRLSAQRAAARQTTCAVCAETFTRKRSDATTCSPKCRTALYRARMKQHGQVARGVDA